ncbi:MAG: gliding motility-associated ABC transporter ATP-binding subunit GldA [Chitinophagales bacterium]
MSVIVKNIAKTYGSQKAVNNISFEINKGEIVGFLGPNGAGKSTTMKMISCFIAPTAGTAEVCGIDILENPIAVKSKIGYLPESNPLYYDMYVKEYLSFVADAYKIPNKKKRIEEIIAMTGLNIECHKQIGQLSKGYKQRVGLAQAMIHDPEVLILDEPTSGLDPNQLADIRQLIRNIGKEKTVILSTHIMQEVEAMCDRILIINKGNLVANESVEGIHSKKNLQQVVKFKVKGSLSEKIFEGYNLKALNNNFYKITSNEKTDLREIVFNKCVKHNVLLLHLEKEEENLENVFMDLTSNKS